MRNLRIDRLAQPAGELCDDRGTRLARCVYRADHLGARAIGLLFTPDLRADEALWLEPCSAIHTCGMRIPLTCVFMDRAGRILRVIPRIAPWRMARCPGARSVVEMRVGSADVTEGRRLHIRPTPHFVR